VTLDLNVAAYLKNILKTFRGRKNSTTAVGQMKEDGKANQRKEKKVDRERRGHYLLLTDV
jgi:hypothetical protein